MGQLDTCRGGWVIAYGRNRFHVDFERDGRYQVTGTDESGRPFRDGDLRGTLTVARALGTVEQVPLASGEAALVGKGQPVSGIASARFVIELGVSGRVAFDLPFAPGSRRFTGGELQATLAASAR